MAARTEWDGPECVVIVGHSGVGKTTLATALGACLGIQAIELGLIVRGEAADGRTNLSALEHAERLFSAGEATRFAKAALRLTSSGNIPLFVGPRRPEEVEYLTSRFGRALVLGLHAGAKVRHSRKTAAQVAAGGQPSTQADLRRRDVIEVRWGIERALRIATYSLDANASVDQVLRRSVECVADWFRVDDGGKCGDGLVLSRGGLHSATSASHP